MWGLEIKWNGERASLALEVGKGWQCVGYDHKWGEWALEVYRAPHGALYVVPMRGKRSNTVPGDLSRGTLHYWRDVGESVEVARRVVSDLGKWLAEKEG